MSEWVSVLAVGVLVLTQLLGACQKALLVGEDVVEDEELGGEGVTLALASPTFPVLRDRQTETGGVFKSNLSRIYINLHMLMKIQKAELLSQTHCYQLKIPLKY